MADKQPLGLLSDLPQVADPYGSLPSRAGIATLKLTPQERYLYEHHVNNLLSGKAVNNADGSVSTVYSIGVQGPDGRTYNLPSVWDGRILSPRDAVRRVAAVGWKKFPSYATPAEADARYEQMHQFMARDVP